MFGQDLLFLRNLVLDGRWGDAERFTQPFMSTTSEFNATKVMYHLQRQRFLELVAGQELKPEVMELVNALKQLEQYCSKQEFNNLCYCLTLDTLTGT